MLLTGAGGGGASAPAWYADALVAYQPKGAASLAASYVNLGTSGATNDAAPGVAPTFAAATGWTFNGTTQYLTTALAPSVDQTWSMFVQYTNAVTGTATCTIAGMYQDVGDTGGFNINLDNAASANQMTVQNGHRFGGNTPVATILTAGNYGFAGRKVYRNGVDESSDVNVLAGSGGAAVFIGARDNNGTAEKFLSVKIVAFAVFNRTLSAGEVTTLVTAMAAL